MSERECGILYIVSTPIGNLEDLSPRAVACLRDADIVACEDTRRTGLLLSGLGFKKRLVSYHDHNAARRVPSLIRHLKEGLTVSLVSDAGTPGVSDPAYRAVRAAIDEGIDVIPIPGPSALLAALVVSGLPLDRFVFEGFLSPKRARRKNRLAELSSETRTMVFYESPYRIIAMLTDVMDVLGDREVSVSRELTKLFEETVRGPISSTLETMQESKPRGEYTVVVRGLSAKEKSCPENS